MLQPKRQKYRKQFRGKIKGKTFIGDKLIFGDCGLKAMDAGWIKATQLEAARKAIAHYTKRGGRIYIRVFPDKAVTNKPAEVKMGGGKGEISGYVAVIRPGRVLFEISGVVKEDAMEALRRASFKLPLKTKFIVKD